MSRLRVRMELNRGGVGVPLQKLARVVDEAQKFFHMLGEDVHIGKGSGEWLGFDFDNTSLNFTAEYVGPVNPDQVREFHAAFDGVTLLRRATIAQFARIADPIEEDELIGFGLYQNDREEEPSEWRSLSKREALRITEEIRLLLDRAEGTDGASRIPAALDPNAAASLFKDRRDHGTGDRRVEGLSQRVERLEGEVTGHSEAIQTLRGTTTNTEQNLQKLLVTVDAFCDRAARQIERLPAAEPAEIEKPSLPWRVPAIVAVILLVGFFVFRSGSTPREAVRPALPQAADAAKQDAPPAQPSPAPQAKAMEPTPSNVQRVELKAIEPAWVGIYIDDKPTFANMLPANQTKTIESPGRIRIRLGNAGGVAISVNGNPVGALGRKGQVRIIDVAAGEFHFVPLASAGK